MISILMALVGMVALAGIFDAWDHDPSSEDHSNETDDSPGAPRHVYQVEVGLKDNSFDLPDFDPVVDIVVLETRTLDLDFSLDESGDVLSVFYGDAVTQLSASWGSGGVGDSVIVRHIVGDGDNESSVDYLLKLSGDVGPGSDPVFVEIGDQVSQLSLTEFHGILNLGDENNSLELQGNFLSTGQAFNLDGDRPELGAVPELFLQGGDNNDLVRFIDLRGDVSLGQGDDSFEMSGGEAQVYMGDGNDHLDASSAQSANDAVVGLGGTGNDTMSGSSGNDYLDGGQDDDTVSGLNGDDTIVGGTAADLLYGGSGNDTLVGSRDTQFLPPGSQKTFEDLSDRAGDTMFGGSGDDIISMDQYDTASGGTGSDDFTVYYDPTKEGPAKIDDFDHLADSLRVVVKLNDELMREWNGCRLDDGAFNITAKVEWSLIDASKSTYLLQFGGYDVAEVISEASPSVGSVAVFGYMSV